MTTPRFTQDELKAQVGRAALDHVVRGAIVGVGSVITADVEADSLGVARGKQQGFAGWAKRFRERMQAKRKASDGSLLRRIARNPSSTDWPCSKSTSNIS